MATGIADWREMRAAFKTGDLDLAFYCGPLGAELIEDIAHDGKAVLLSLGDITEAIQYEMGLQVYAAKSPKESRCCEGPFEERFHRTMRRPWHLPRRPAYIAIRRVLACPRSLATSDAYLLASVARAVLEDKGYHINLRADDPPFRLDMRVANDQDKSDASRLHMLLHPGLKLLRDGRAPLIWRDWTTWPAWMQTLAGIFCGLLALDALRLLTSRIDTSHYGQSIRSIGLELVLEKLYRS